MNKGISAFVLSCSLLAGCSPKGFQATQTCAEQTATTLSANPSQSGSCIFDGTCSEDIIHLLGQAYRITTDTTKQP